MSDELVYAKRNACGFFRGGISLVGSEHQPIKLDDGISIKWRDFRIPPDDPDDPTIREINGDVYDGATRVAYFQAYALFPFDESYDNLDMHDACDAFDQTLCDFACAFSTSDISVFDLCDFYEGNLLFIHLIELIPSYQNRGLGRTILEKLFEITYKKYNLRVGVIEPTPLQFVSPLPEGHSTEEREDWTRALSELTDYYNRILTLKQMGETGYYYFDVHDPPAGV